MDTLYILHLTFVIFFLSIPFWSIKYLQYGIFAPITLATIWVLFDGCPLTKIQKGLNDEYFARILLQYISPNISKEATTRVSHFILLLVTFIGCIRLCPSILPWNRKKEKEEKNNLK